jgi:hypothetical protein
MDDLALIDRLRSDLQAERAAVVAPEGMHVSGHRRWQRRRARRLRAGGALAVALVLGGAAVVAAQVDDGAPVETRRLAPIDTTTTAPEGPSQTPEDAARDGVDPEVAALTTSQRLYIVASQEAPPEGRYVISRPPRAPAEVLVLDDQDRIVRAFPMGGLGPTWLTVTSEEVVGGRFEEAMHAGAQPFATIFRIDRRTLELTGFAFPVQGIPAPLGEDGYVETTVDEWAPAPEGAFAFEYASVVEHEGWEQGASTEGRVWVDVEGLRTLFGLPPF